MVVLYHAFARWHEIVPYGSDYKLFFGVGWLGVQLFFLISGFVILMTLEKCSEFKGFIYRRWLRLFPAMLFCSVVIYLTAPFFIERPAGEPAFSSLFPGLLFMEPSWLKIISGHPVTPLEGAFWSLYVEFKFYIIAGLIYYNFGRSRLVVYLTVLSLFGLLCVWLSKDGSAPYYIQLVAKVGTSLSLQHFGWFAAGAAVYIYTQSKNAGWLFAACGLAAFSSLFVRFGFLSATLTAFMVSVLFMGSVVTPLIRRIFEHRVFQFFGFISYPLYLVHENFMVASVIKLGNIGWDVPRFFYPLVPIAVLCLFSFYCAKYVEPNLRTILAGALGRRRQRAFENP